MKRISALTRSLLDYSGQPGPGSRKLREGAADAKFPAHQVNGIWHFREEDLPAIAAAYGLVPKVAPVQQAERRRKSAQPASIAA